MNEDQINALVAELLALFAAPNLADDQGHWIATPRQVAAWLKEKLGSAAN